MDQCVLRHWEKYRDRIDGTEDNSLMVDNWSGVPHSEDRRLCDARLQRTPISKQITQRIWERKEL